MERIIWDSVGLLNLADELKKASRAVEDALGRFREQYNNILCAIPEYRSSYSSECVENAERILRLLDAASERTSRLVSSIQKANEFFSDSEAYALRLYWDVPNTVQLREEAHEDNRDYPKVKLMPTADDGSVITPEWLNLAARQFFTSSGGPNPLEE